MTKHIRRSPPRKDPHPGETQAEFELRVLNGHRLGAIRAPADLSLPVFHYPTAGQLKAYPASVDLRSHDAPIFDQGQLGDCHSADTSVLTIQGWKLFKDISNDDKLATVNPEDGGLIFEHPNNITAYHYDGDMYHFNHKSLDALVTPNHKMLVRKWNESAKTLDEDYQLIEAQDVGWYVGLCNKVRYHGNNTSDTYTFQPIEHKHKSRVKSSVNLKYWLRFLGMFVAEGTLVNIGKHYRTQIACVKQEEKEYFKDILSHLDLNASEYTDRFFIHNKEVFNELCYLGFYKKKAPEKFVPNFVFTLSAKYIAEFLDGYFHGDGCDSNNNKMYYTSSPVLAEQAQALIILAGGWASVSTRAARKGGVVNGHQINGAHPQHTIIEWNGKNLSIDKKANLEVIPYSGMVYCAEVPTYHTLVTKRNGKALISGNCVGNCWAGGFQWLQNSLEPSVSFAGSRLALYKWARDHDGTTGDVGTTDPTMAWVVSNKGVPHESLWTYDISQFDVEPTSNVVTDAANAKATTVSTVATTLAGIKAAINEPVPVMFTFDVYNAYEDATDNGGKIGMPSGGSIGGHCNMVVGYNDETVNLDNSLGAFIVRNSWGTSWGGTGADAGYGFMPYGYATQGYMASGYVITAESEIVVTPPTPTPPTPTAADNINLTAAVRTYQAGTD